MQFTIGWHLISELNPEILNNEKPCKYCFVIHEVSTIEWIKCEMNRYNADRV